MIGDRGMRRGAFALPAMLVLLLLLPLGCNRGPRPQVQAAEARRAPLRVEVATNGTAEPVDDIEMRARLDGRVVDIPDEPGKRVEAGDEVARFDAVPVTSELAAAQSERLVALESLRAARAAAEQTRARAATDAALYEKGALTREAHEASRRALAEAEAQLAYQDREVPLRVAGLDLRIKELTEQYEATVVRAPFAGTIYKIQAKKGEMVRVGDPLLWLADLDHLRVRANVDQVDLGRVRPSHRVEVTANAFPGRSWTGAITELIPHVVVKESRSVSEGLARLDPPTNGLVPGMMVDVDIIVAEKPSALQVPTEAVFYRDGQPIVYRIDGNRVRETPVRLGLSSVSATEIADGLPEGTLVVVGPVADIEDGMRVDIQPTGAATS
jgi:RND family efflux transporter MFP subunit